MHIHFTKAELAERRARCCEAMQKQGLYGLLMFRQESMFYLTGYDTFGYVFFQCLYLGADGTMTLLTRAPDLRQAQHTSVIDDIRIWIDGPEAEPAEDLRGILDEHGCRGKRLGVEYEAYGLTARNGKRLDAALAELCHLSDASMLVSEQRVIKSPSEIAYVRRAAELADDAWDQAVALTAPGRDEADILAAMQGAVFEGGGDYPGNEFIIGSGPGALCCRYFTGRRVIGTEDQLTLEWAGAYRHYHAAMMRTIPVGPVPDRQREMHNVAHDALLAVEDALRPGSTIGEAFDAHSRVMDAAGFQAHRMNACGYSLGTTFSPNWMDWPMLYHGNPVETAPGMVIFVHMVIFDSEKGLAMTLGRTSLIGTQGAEPLSRMPLDFISA
ncbi:M24 family metallopeptidase [Denitrobaculum tricleocarpae]|uniref:Aminopeptidase P family protein n=1 Tax=Denitrobaculum tricleocarpae TaxID=2591009 RepID=A0A545U263_9PROT|nr:Xaa-Pro peptidase family protein [Denitrobaculum tricleocarpae]TQV83548.1 aminopeptidase P family protein [Denitrobaculum tricleocarpae]